jgi:hypothetical protein
MAVMGISGGGKTRPKIAGGGVNNLETAYPRIPSEKFVSEKNSLT